MASSKAFKPKKSPDAASPQAELGGVAVDDKKEDKKEDKKRDGGLSQVSFRYGEDKQVVTLTQSSDLVGIKARRDVVEKDLEGVLGAEVKNFKQVSRLGGFRVLRCQGKPCGAALDGLRKSGPVDVGTHVWCTVKDNNPIVPTGELYITFREDADPEQCTELLDKHRLAITDVRGEREFVVRVTKGSSNPIKLTVALQNSPLIDVAEPNLSVPIKPKAFELPTDEYLKDQWHLKNVGQHRGTRIGVKAGADARVVEAWQQLQSLGSSSITVAIIDDGFDLKHPDINGAHIINPYDFTRNSSNPIPGPVSVDEDGYITGDWHGTACAGVAVGNVGRGKIIGAAPSARLMPVRWGYDISDSQIEKWFKYVTSRGADVVSCSWGAANPYFPLSTRKAQAIRNCATNGRNGKGCIIVFAAGNENHDINNPSGGTLDGFATHPDVIAVAASTSVDRKADYSNFGKEICVCAPSSGAGGMGILTADVTGQFTYGGDSYWSGYSEGDYTEDFGGTSSSCPLVAGICALILSANSSLTRKEVRSILQKTARPIGGMSAGEFSPEFGYGCINAAGAVKMAQEMRGAAPAAPVEKKGKK